MGEGEREKGATIETGVVKSGQEKTGQAGVMSHRLLGGAVQMALVVQMPTDEKDRRNFVMFTQRIEGVIFAFATVSRIGQ